MAGPARITPAWGLEITTDVLSACCDTTGGRAALAAGGQPAHAGHADAAESDSRGTVLRGDGATAQFPFVRPSCSVGGNDEY